MWYWCANLDNVFERATTKFGVEMANWFKFGTNESHTEYNLDNVRIDKNGVVRLNLGSKDVKAKIVEQVEKLRNYEQQTEANPAE